MSETFQEDYNRALQTFESGDTQTAYHTLRPLLQYPADLNELARWQQAWQLFGRISSVYGGPQLADKINQIVAKPNDVRALYQAGYELIEQQQYGPAATVLARANRLNPGQQGLLTELVVALENIGLNAEACRWLLASPDLIENTFICRYLLAFNSIMSGDLSRPQQLLAGLQKYHGQDEVVMTGRIAAMLARAEAIKPVAPLDDRDLRGWHFVITGGWLLHLSPYGLDEPMHGRYAFLQDNYSLIAEGIQRLAAILQNYQIDVPAVIALPDRNSQIIASATAQILNKPLQNWSNINSNAAGLVVAYNLRELDDEAFRVVSEHRPDQILWSHAHEWTDSFPYTADLITLLYQVNVAPWAAGRLKFNDATGQADRSEAEVASVDELAARIVHAQADPDTIKDLPALLTLVQAGKSGWSGSASSGRREKFWDNSPVKSNRFA